MSMEALSIFVAAMSPFCLFLAYVIGRAQVKPTIVVAAPIDLIRPNLSPETAPVMPFGALVPYCPTCGQPRSIERIC